MPKTTTPKAVNPISETPASPIKSEKEELVSIFIDPEMVGRSGIRINDKLYIGHVKVPIGLSVDLLRIQEEYWETVKKMKDPNVVVRMKNDFQKERLFLADPNENAGKKGYTRDYGLLPQREFLLCSPTFQEHLLAYRKQLYNF